jgi:hypothetical protein
MFGFICNVVLAVLIVYPFVKTRKSGFSKMMLSPPWSIFQNSFMRMFDIECQTSAKDLLEKGELKIMSFSSMVTTVVWSVILSKFVVVYISTYFCSPWLIVVYIVTTLVRMPVFYVGYLRVNKYINNPKLIKRIA